MDVEMRKAIDECLAKTKMLIDGELPPGTEVVADVQEMIHNAEALGIDTDAIELGIHLVSAAAWMVTALGIALDVSMARAAQMFALGAMAQAEHLREDIVDATNADGRHN